MKINYKCIRIIFEQIKVLGLHGGTRAEGYHPGVMGTHFLHDFAFDVAEFYDVDGGPQFRIAAPCFCFDSLVNIEIRPTQMLGSSLCQR